MIRRAAALSVAILAACGGGNANGPAPSTPTNAAPEEGDEGRNDSANDASPAPPPTSLDCGDFSTCAVGSDGIARCWGRNKDGELGQSEKTKEQGKCASVPGLGKVTKIALASQLSCAILESKRVKCWG